ncbi:MAG TPA: universal stress protein [Actinomycetota bacterium]|nr:universal stress protein [Actinomycetota bacterium]
MGTVLVGTDTSSAADLAVETAADLARARGADLVVVYVRPATAARDVFDADKAADPAEYLAGMPRRFPGVKVRIRQEHGDPAEGICRVAGDERADVIVVGNRGVHGRLLSYLRSVPNEVLRRAQSSVLVVDTRSRQ